MIFLKETHCCLQLVSSADGQHLVLHGVWCAFNDLMPTESTKEFGCALHWQPQNIIQLVTTQQQEQSISRGCFLMKWPAKAIGNMGAILLLWELRHAHLPGYTIKYLALHVDFPHLVHFFSWFTDSRNCSISWNLKLAEGSSTTDPFLQLCSQPSCWGFWGIIFASMANLFLVPNS